MFGSVARARFLVHVRENSNVVHRITPRILRMDLVLRIAIQLRRIRSSDLRQ